MTNISSLVLYVPWIASSRVCAVLSIVSIIRFVCLLISK